MATPKKDRFEVSYTRLCAAAFCALSAFCTVNALTDSEQWKSDAARSALMAGGYALSAWQFGRVMRQAHITRQQPHISTTQRYNVQAGLSLGLVPLGVTLAFSAFSAPPPIRPEFVVFGGLIAVGGFATWRWDLHKARKNAPEQQP